MGQKLPTDQMELYRRTDEVLHYIWDPIGISAVPEARDEYYGYLPKVYTLLLEGNERGIRDYLSEITADRMALELSQQMRERIDQTIESLLQWKKKSLGGTDPSTSSG